MFRQIDEMDVQTDVEVSSIQSTPSKKFFTNLQSESESEETKMWGGVEGGVIYRLEIRFRDRMFDVRDVCVW